MSFSLDGIRSTLSGKLTQPEADLNAQLAALKSGKEMTLQDMTLLQVNVASVTMLSQLIASVVAEFVNTMKGVVQKI